MLPDPDGYPVDDVLYRAPFELWDRSMRHLTILLDPDRLKRGVGPNVALGPPLQPGREYALRIGPGMLDATGQPLRGGFRKYFQVARAIREPVDIQRWKLEPPGVGICEPVTLLFPEPLDWAMLWRGITIETANGVAVQGTVTLGDGERRWSFRPASPWTVGTYRVRVAPDLEDVCGNNVAAAFDGPLHSENWMASEKAARVVTFQPRGTATSFRPAEMSSRQAL